MSDFRKLERHDMVWCLERLPGIVKKIMRQEPAGTIFIAGGFVRACVAGESINDVDIFVPDKTTAKRLADQVLEAMNGSSFIMATDNAYTIPAKPFAIQFIHRWTFANVEACIASFDFTIACAAIFWNGATFDSAVDQGFYPDLAAKRLIYRSPIREEEPGGSMLRVLKFYQRGYRIPLDSLGAVLARMMHKFHTIPSEETEEHVAKVMTGLLYDVDPNLTDRQPYLPSKDLTD
jgi:hypothetical protein